MALANKTAKAIKKVLHNKRLFYVCRDAERAEAGLYLNLRNFKIFTNASDWSAKLKIKFPGQIYEVKNKTPLDTIELLKHSAAKNAIKKGDLVMVFKPTVQIEAICGEMNWRLINPPAKLANRVEEKMSQIEWLGPLKKILPETKILSVKNIPYKNKKFIVQFNRAHTGSGTMLINSAKQLNELKKRFPEREARVSLYAEGPSFTINCVVWGNSVLLSSASYQITGLKPLTDNPFATVGNDWTLPANALNAKQKKQIKKIALSVGKKLAKDGWRGLFGIDIIVEKKSGRVYLIEINARQPASTSFESFLQKQKDKYGLTTFLAHLAALLDLKQTDTNILKINDGAQFIQRVTADIPSLPEPKIVTAPDFRVIRYKNEKSGSDLLRLQSFHGAMKSPNQLNGNGLRITEFINFVKSERAWGANRAGAIIIKNGRILLIKRQRNNRRYFAMPGGTIEKSDKNTESAAKRETKEETNLNFEIDKSKKPIIIKLDRTETYYWAKNIRGIVKLGGPEKKRDCANNRYDLVWINLSKLKQTNLLPPMLKKELILCFRPALKK